MTWRSRLRLISGLVVVLGIVAVLTLVFTQRQSQVASDSASIEAERFPIGIDYGGTVVERLVDEGDLVAQGDPLFVVLSTSLQADLADGLLKPETIAYAVTADGTITLTAAVAGTVRDVTTERGSFVQAGQVLATVDRAGSLFVTAEYELTSRDYGRIENGAEVTLLLPDDQRIAGTVTSVQVSTSEGIAQTVVLVHSDELSDGGHNGLMARGTPVTATLQLRNDGVLAGVSDGLFDFFRKIGV
ncbi:HlyD family efflux transporter periplasmic adaptor subunit [Mycetocola zhujimingii]|uniref:HlyD family efflux transporter periplasmic adaptor subunit n=1 Tax=Mycetocola zhujimingii TaxID=2079792 RepID=UPI001304C0E4|nr:HlyD family efflux transporter periplasmic adaptor subunit [Mycetocola zhujimingii]